MAERRALIIDQEIMKWTMGNAITQEDTNGNRKLFRKRSDEKIDNVAALVDAYVAYKANKEAFE
jgi:phage terminase large subunit-like protein